MDMLDVRAVVTGGNSGLGAAVAARLEQLGAIVWRLDLQGDACIKCDITQPDQLEAAFDHIIEVYSCIPNVVVNCAGIVDNQVIAPYDNGKDVFYKHDMEKFKKVVDVNLIGAANVVNEFVNRRLNCVGACGVIITISSICSAGNLGQWAYSATKAAIEAMAVVQSKELFKRYRIRSSVIAPGYVDTPMVASVPKKVMDEKVIPAIPAGRLATADEIADTVVYLIKSEYQSGRVIQIDGGMRI